MTNRLTYLVPFTTPAGEFKAIAVTAQNDDVTREDFLDIAQQLFGDTTGLEPNLDLAAPIATPESLAIRAVAAGVPPSLLDRLLVMRESATQRARQEVADAIA